MNNSSCPVAHACEIKLHREPGCCGQHESSSARQSTVFMFYISRFGYHSEKHAAGCRLRSISRSAATIFGYITFMCDAGQILVRGNASGCSCCCIPKRQIVILIQRSSQWCWDDGQALQIVSLHSPKIQTPSKGRRRKNEQERDTNHGSNVRCGRNKVSIAVASCTNRCTWEAPAIHSNRTMTAAWCRSGMKSTTIFFSPRGGSSGKRHTSPWQL